MSKLNHRRAFVKQSLFLTAALLYPYGALKAFSKAPALDKGIQLYTLRTEMQQGPETVLKEVAKAGYTYVESYGYDSKSGFFNLSAKQFKDLLDENHLKCISGHYDINEFLKSGDPQTLLPALEAANTLESRFFTIPWIDEQYRQSAADYQKLAHQFNRLGELCKKHHLKLAYHNHDFEFQTFKKDTGLDLLLQHTEPALVDFELDIYWSAFARVSTLALLKKHSHRFKLWHVKDMDKKDRKLNTEIGSGRIDYQALFKLRKELGMKYFFLEQENNYHNNVYESISKSAAYLDRQLLS